MAILIIIYIAISILFVFSIFKAGSLLHISNKENENDYKKHISNAGKWLKRAAFIGAIFIVLLIYALSCNFY
jgi:hypothetical protein